MKKQIQHKISIFDWILTIILLSISIGSLISMNIVSLDNGKQASIYINNELIMGIDLSQDKITKIDYMVIEVKEGRLRAFEAECPRKICVHTGWISRPSQTIVCVTNKILIEITGKAPDADYDVISY